MFTWAAPRGGRLKNRRRGARVAQNPPLLGTRVYSCRGKKDEEGSSRNRKEVGLELKRSAKAASLKAPRSSPGGCRTGFVSFSKHQAVEERCTYSSGRDRRTRVEGFPEGNPTRASSAQTGRRWILQRPRSAASPAPAPDPGWEASPACLEGCSARHTESLTGLSERSRPR